MTGRTFADILQRRRSPERHCTGYLSLTRAKPGYKEQQMKGERSRITAGQKIVKSLTKEEREAREREAVQDRGKLREEFARKRQER